jgi:plasmid stabilization system protein ParE
MTLRVVFRRAAQAEFVEAAAWYEQQREGLGEEFIREIETAIIKASQFHASYPIVSGDVRRTVIRRFPYCIYFRTRQSYLVVLAVFHGRRDPKVWQGR